jgi:hypothetical protein
MLETFLPIFLVLGSGVLLLYYFMYTRRLLAPLWREFALRPKLLLAWETSAFITAGSFLTLSVLVAESVGVNFDRFVVAYGLFLGSAFSWALLHLVWQSPWPPFESLVLGMTAAASLYMYWVAAAGSRWVQLFTVPVVVHHVFWDFIVRSAFDDCAIRMQTNRVRKCVRFGEW